MRRFATISLAVILVGFGSVFQSRAEVWNAPPSGRLSVRVGDTVRFEAKAPDVKGFEEGLPASGVEVTFGTPGLYFYAWRAGKHESIAGQIDVRSPKAREPFAAQLRNPAVPEVWPELEPGALFLEWIATAPRAAL